MLSLLLVLPALALASALQAGTHRERRVHMFEPDEVYTYAFHGQTTLATGSASATHSGMDVRCVVDCQAASASDDRLVVHFHARNVTVLEWDGQTAAFLPSSMSPFYDASLSRHPFSAAFDHAGNISSVWLAPEDDVWVANLKRSFLSALHVHLLDGDLFTSMHADLTGTCRARHSVRRRDGQDALEISRVRDHSDCESRALHHNMQHPSHLTRVQQDLSSSTDSLHVLNTTTRLVMSASHSESHIYTGLGASRVSHAASRTSLSLMSSSSSQHRPVISVQREHLVLTTLAYEHPAKSLDAASSDDAEHLAAVRLSILALVHSNASSLTPAIELLQQHPVVLSLLVDDLHNRTARGRLVDVITAVGSSDSHQFVCKYVLDNVHMPVDVRLRVLMNTAYLPHPSPAMFRDVARLASAATGADTLADNALLAFASMVYAQRQANPDLMKQPLAPLTRAILEPVARTLKDSASISLNRNLEQLYISTLGNAGLVDYIDSLLAVILRPTIPSPALLHTMSGHQDARVSAIRALRHMRPLPSIARSALIVIYFGPHLNDNNNDMKKAQAQPDSDAVRIAAFRALMDSNEDLYSSEVTRLVQSLAHESSVEVGSYVLSHFKSLAASATDASLARHVRGILSDMLSFSASVSLYGIELNLGFSKSKEWLFLGNTEFGASIGFDLVNEAAVFIPRSGHVRFDAEIRNVGYLRAYAFKKLYNLVEVGFTVEGLEFEFGGIGNGARRRDAHDGNDITDSEEDNVEHPADDVEDDLLSLADDPNAVPYHIHEQAGHIEFYSLEAYAAFDNDTPTDQEKDRQTRCTPSASATYAWVTAPWGCCSKKCMPGGKQTRSVKCASYVGTTVECANVAAVKCAAVAMPASERTCNTNLPCPVAGSVGEMAWSMAPTCETYKGTLGLSKQLLEELSCMHPGKLKNALEIPEICATSGAFPWVQDKTFDELKASVEGQTKFYQINSAIRSIAQQYVLYKYRIFTKGTNGTCYKCRQSNIVGTPGNSNHQSGGAIDFAQNSRERFKTVMNSKWSRYSDRHPGRDKPHYDRWPTSDLVSFKADSIRAFQRLHNRNCAPQPSCKIAETGVWVWDGELDRALFDAPRNGYSGGASCSTPLPGANEPPSCCSKDLKKKGRCIASSTCKNNGGATLSGLCPGISKCCVDEPVDGVEVTISSKKEGSEDLFPVPTVMTEQQAAQSQETEDKTVSVPVPKDLSPTNLDSLRNIGSFLRPNRIRIRLTKKPTAAVTLTLTLSCCEPDGLGSCNQVTNNNVYGFFDAGAATIYPSQLNFAANSDTYKVYQSVGVSNNSPQPQFCSVSIQNYSPAGPYAGYHITFDLTLPALSVCRAYNEQEVDSTSGGGTGRRRGASTDEQDPITVEVNEQDAVHDESHHERHQHTQSRRSIDGDDASLSCNCPEAAPEECQSGLCAVNSAFCSFINSQERATSNMDGTDDKTCAVPSGSTGAPSCNVFGSMPWLSDGQQFNLAATCHALLRSDADENLFKCVQNNLISGLQAVDSSYQSAYAALKGTVVPGNAFSADEYHRKLVNGGGGLPSPSQAETVFSIYKTAYETCCCAETPGQYLAWIASTPVKMEPATVNYNHQLYGTCENRATVSGDKPGITGYFFINLLGQEWKRWYVFGQDPNDTGDRRRRRQQVMSEFDERGEALVASLPSNHPARLDHRARRGFIKDNLADLIANLDPAQYCLSYPAIKIMDLSVPFFPPYVQYVPLILGVALEIRISAGAYFRIYANAEVCPLALSAGGSIGPDLGAELVGSVALNAFVIRAGITLSIELLQNSLRFSADLAFASKPFQVCFDLTREQNPLTFKFEAFVQLRTKIKWCKVWGVPIPCGLTWGKRHAITLGSGSLSSNHVIDVMWTNCKADVNTRPVATPAQLTVGEDVLYTGTLAGTDSDGDSLTFAIHTEADGLVVLTDETSGTFTYRSAKHRAGTDTFGFTANDGEEESEPAFITITVTPISDPPAVTVEPMTGTQGSSVNLDIEVELVDIDGSEQLSVALCDCSASLDGSACSSTGACCLEIPTRRLDYPSAGISSLLSGGTSLVPKSLLKTTSGSGSGSSLFHSRERATGPASRIHCEARGSQGECQKRAVALGATFRSFAAGQTCAQVSCSLSTPGTLGACCLNNGFSGTCHAQASAADCQTRATLLGWTFGSFNPSATCSDSANVCPSIMTAGGTCCLQQGTTAMCEHHISESVCRDRATRSDNVVFRSFTSGLNCPTTSCPVLITPCLTSPCRNGATCTETSTTTYTCTCVPGFQGTDCEQDVDECASQPCANGAVCIDGVDNFACRCVAANGFGGELCDAPIDECLSSPCENGGTCVDKVASYECTCLATFTGDSCQTDYNACTLVPCKNGAACASDPITGFVCTCATGWLGTTCEQPVDYCESSPCVNGGVCSLNTASATPFAQCTCSAGYNGDACETNIDECAAAPCQNGGTCRDGVASFVCDCVPGYQGTVCATNIDDCSPNPCSVNGVCHDLVNGYRCDCTPGYTDPLCATNTDECATSPCQNGGVCVDGVNEYACSCAYGWIGVNCDTLEDECISSPCLNGGQCVNADNKYECRCATGYAGVQCATDIDECASMPCLNGAACVNGVGGFACTCLPGYHGTTCATNTDECAIAPCKNGAACVDGVNMFTCTCVAGYTGQVCDVNIDECAAVTCQNGGTCQDGVNDFTCVCEPGYAGDLCDVNIDECASTPCINGGVCIDGVDAFSCTCVVGYAGAQCESNINECASTPCVNGMCVDAINAFSCTCDAGYAGTLCDTDIDECTTTGNGSPCLNGGVCSDLVNGYKCTCAAGYAGATCAENIDECAANPCLNGGVCTDGINLYTCQCAVGYEGSDCDTNTDDCAADPCLNGATCVDRLNAFTCSCAAGYRGTLCAENIDECAPIACQNGGTCVDGVDQFQCVCANGWHGVLCETDTDECASSPCPRGECIAAVGAFSCRCPTGYGGTLCETDINECETNPCLHGGSCTDTVGAAVCTCVEGYGGDTCANNIDDCAQNPCVHGTCFDRVNAFECVCTAGYEGATCSVDTNECASSPCDNTGVCSDKVNGYVCACPAGFAGTHCSQNIDDCVPNPCQNSGVCADGANAFTCTCAAGYEGDTCADNINDCATQPCKNGAVCHDGLLTFTCTCAAGYTGDICNVNIDDCAADPCQHGGTCVDAVNGFTCTCVAGYAGATCSHDVDECAAQPCLSGGTCVDEINGYSCTCATGYAGATCAENIDDCAQHGCANGATCVDHVNRYSCNCKPGYAGTLCEINVSDCSPSPCVNGGVCKDGVNSYVCICPVGYAGATCATNVNECASSPCHNGGVCVDEVGAYGCICADGYGGNMCQVNIDECASEPCLNGATCVDAVDGFTCKCAAGFAGDMCAGNIDECASTPCQNGGVCTDLVNAFSCACASGFTDTTCSTNIDDCKAESCHNGGTCVDLVDAVRCTCAAGWQGIACNEQVLECESNPCVNGACVDATNGYICKCETGWAGVACDFNIDDCAGSPCLNGGVCSDAVNAFTCACPAGFAGATCGTNIDECAPAPCLNGGLCADAINGFKCTCATGFSGTTCSVNNDDCSPQPCKNGATCTDLVNSYRCTCVPGYAGTLCDTNINDCSPNPCANGASCVDQVNAYKCLCPPGFVGTTCATNVDDCAGNPCGSYGSCSDGVNGFTCTCETGFSGTTCQTNNNDCVHHGCSNGATCVDGVNTYTCSCTTGYSGTYCQTNSNDCFSGACLHGGTCVDGLNTYTCKCLAGYSGSRCATNDNDCSPNPCANGGACQDGVNSYTCSCATGWTGTQCTVAVNYCQCSPCRNGATCTSHSSGYTCACAPGYSGSSCTVNTNECASAPCQNLGTCVDGINGYTCTCLTGFTGSTCGTNINDCACNPCQNGGTCTDLINGFTCSCATGYAGSTCSFDINECACNPCLNGGACVNNVGYYTCTCASGYTGSQCGETIVNSCASSPCKNGAGCVPISPSAYKCICVSPYTGTTCTEVNRPCCTRSSAGVGACSLHTSASACFSYASSASRTYVSYYSSSTSCSSVICSDVSSTKYVCCNSGQLRRDALIVPIEDGACTLETAQDCVGISILGETRCLSDSCTRILQRRAISSIPAKTFLSSGVLAPPTSSATSVCGCNGQVQFPSDEWKITKSGVKLTDSAMQSLSLADLASLEVVPDPDFSGKFAFQVVGLSQEKEAGIPAAISNVPAGMNILPVNEAPTVSATLSSVSVALGDFVALGSFTVADSDLGGDGLLVVNVEASFGDAHLWVSTSTGVTFLGVPPADVEERGVSAYVEETADASIENVYVTLRDALSVGVVNGNSRLRMMGTPIALNAALSSLQYESGAAFVGADTVTLSVSDLFAADLFEVESVGLSASTTIAVTVTGSLPVGHIVTSGEQSEFQVSSSGADDSLQNLFALSVLTETSDTEVELEFSFTDAPDALTAPTAATVSSANLGTYVVVSQSPTKYRVRGTASSILYMLSLSTVDASKSTTHCRWRMLAKLYVSPTGALLDTHALWYTKSGCTPTATLTMAPTQTVLATTSEGTGVTITSANWQLTSTGAKVLVSLESDDVHVIFSSVASGVTVFTAKSSQDHSLIGGTTSLQLLGSAAAVSSTLNAIEVQPQLRFSGIASIHVRAVALGAHEEPVEMVSMDAVALVMSSLVATNLIEVTVTDVNHEPSLLYPSYMTVSEHESNEVHSFGVFDDDLLAVGGSLVVLVEVTAGTLSLADPAIVQMIQGTGTGDAVMSFTGSLQAVNTALFSLVYNAGACAEVSCGATDEFLHIQVTDLPSTPNQASTSIDGVTRLDILCVANAPLVTAPAALGWEDTDVAVSVSVTAVDTKELVYVHMRLPEHASLTNGADLGYDGLWELQLNELAGLKVRPLPNYNGLINITVIGISIEPSVDERATTERTLIVDVRAVNDAPTIKVPPSPRVFEDTLSLLKPIVVHDVDHQWGEGGSYTVVVGITQNGKLSVSQTRLPTLPTGVTVTNDDSACVQVSGPLEGVNTVLKNLMFLGTTNFNGQTVLSVLVDDQGSYGVMSTTTAPTTTTGFKPLVSPLARRRRRSLSSFSGIFKDLNNINNINVHRRGLTTINPNCPLPAGVTGLTASASTNIHVLPVNDEPVIHLAATALCFQCTPVIDSFAPAEELLTALSGLSVSDVDTVAATVTLSVQNGSLFFGNDVATVADVLDEVPITTGEFFDRPAGLTELESSQFLTRRRRRTTTSSGSGGGGGGGSSILAPQLLRRRSQEEVQEKLAEDLSVDELDLVSEIAAETKKQNRVTRFFTRRRRRTVQPAVSAVKVTFEYGSNNTQVMRFVGPISRINTMMAGLMYRGVEDFNGDGELVVSVQDSPVDGTPSEFTSRTFAFAVTPVNDAPNVASFAARSRIRVGGSSTVSFAAFDDGSELGDENTDVEAVLTTAHGTLALPASASSAAGVTVSATTGAAITLRGRANVVNELMTGMTFTADASMVGTSLSTSECVVFASIDDNGNHGAGGPMSADANVTMVVLGCAGTVTRRNLKGFNTAWRYEKIPSAQVVQETLTSRTTSIRFFPSEDVAPSKILRTLQTTTGGFGKLGARECPENTQAYLNTNTEGDLSLRSTFYVPEETLSVYVRVVTDGEAAVYLSDEFLFTHVWDGSGCTTETIFEVPFWEFGANAIAVRVYNHTYIDVAVEADVCGAVRPPSGCTDDRDCWPGAKCVGSPGQCKVSVCGDGIVDFDEFCDDGNRIDDDDCDNECGVSRLTCKPHKVTASDLTDAADLAALAAGTGNGFINGFDRDGLQCTGSCNGGSGMGCYAQWSNAGKTLQTCLCTDGAQVQAPGCAVRINKLRAGSNGETDGYDSAGRYCGGTCSVTGASCEGKWADSGTTLVSCGCKTPVQSGCRLDNRNNMCVGQCTVTGATCRAVTRINGRVTGCTCAPVVAGDSCKLEHRPNVFSLRRLALPFVQLEPYCSGTCQATGRSCTLQTVFGRSSCACSGAVPPEPTVCTADYVRNECTGTCVVNGVKRSCVGDYVNRKLRGCGCGTFDTECTVSGETCSGTCNGQACVATTTTKPGTLFSRPRTVLTGCQCAAVTPSPTGCVANYFKQTCTGSVGTPPRKCVGRYLGFRLVGCEATPEVITSSGCYVRNKICYGVCSATGSRCFPSTYNGVMTKCSCAEVPGTDCGTGGFLRRGKMCIAQPKPREVLGVPEPSVITMEETVLGLDDSLEVSIPPTQLTRDRSNGVMYVIERDPLPTCTSRFRGDCVEAPEELSEFIADPRSTSTTRAEDERPEDVESIEQVFTVTAFESPRLRHQTEALELASVENEETDDAEPVRVRTNHLIEPLELNVPIPSTVDPERVNVLMLDLSVPTRPKRRSWLPVSSSCSAAKRKRTLFGRRRLRVNTCHLTQFAVVVAQCPSTCPSCVCSAGVCECPASSSSVAAIGGGVGAALLIALLALVIVIVVVRRRRQSSRSALLGSALSLRRHDSVVSTISEVVEEEYQAVGMSDNSMMIMDESSTLAYAPLGTAALRYSEDI